MVPPGELGPQKRHPAIFLRRGIEVLPEGFRDQHAAGLIIAFTVDDLPAEYERLKAAGVAISMELREEPWGERLFQVTDPNGVIIQLVDWVVTTGAGACAGTGAAAGVDGE